ncbi:DASS family sodium-coupled anion symporter [Porphyrobacter sp. GA68]|uniref:SLC13 family permease n=1 Tax=Porphyrobacter sp. GA68 TaxID=2883480 RepID=UPI001D18F69D|nr:DASS family sodium-coupled anion symporter [Porphyrobacter sp. GA68]
MKRASRAGLFIGALALVGAFLLPVPAGMTREMVIVAGLVLLMAVWWMTEAIPLTATALMPFVILPLAGVLSAEEAAGAYYSPILFLILGGAFLALAIERTGLHRRLALRLLEVVGGRGGPGGILFAFMATTAALSMVISNTSAALILMPVAIAVLAGGGIPPEERDGLAGALPMGIAFAASIGGLGTLVGSPTNAIAVGLLDTVIGFRISFAQWSLYGLPLVAAGVPLAALIIARVQRIGAHTFDLSAAQAAIGERLPWTRPERRLVPVIVLAFGAWMTVPLVQPLLPQGSWTDGTIAVIAGLALFLIPDGTGRPLLVWQEADRAPWAVIMMFGGGLALAAGIGASGLAAWLGEALLFLQGVPLIVIALILVALVVLVTEFASNVATASAIIPVVAALSVALGADPLLLALPAALAASWGFMLPAGTGPNAIAWATGRIILPRMVRAGVLLDVAGVFLIVGMVWIIYTVTG